MSRQHREAALIGAMSRRITATYEDAHEATRAAGRAWYANALTHAVRMDPTDPARAAGVIAALSPRCSWSQNLDWAREMIAWADSELGLDDLPRVHTHTQRRKAKLIAQCHDPLDVLAGPKERAFYRCIMGYSDAVTVDVWAARVAEGHWKSPSITGRRYERIAAAYRAAARRAGVRPSTIQAATWIHIRGAAD